MRGGEATERLGDHCLERGDVGGESGAEGEVLGGFLGFSVGDGVVHFGDYGVGWGVGFRVVKSLYE